MPADYGFFLILLCVITSVYGTIAAATAGWLGNRRLYYSAKTAALASTLMIWAAALILWFLLFARDYRVAYVVKNSSNDLPFFYTFTAFWSALEGSHLLWTLLLATFSGLVHLASARDNEHLMPYVSTTLQAVLAWMFYLAAAASNPFVLQFPAVENGLGMNVLLQNPYMAIHPPALFIGYTGLAIPFAYAIAALCYGDITQGWLKTVRRWTLFAWSFLTLGIFLGGRWAYVVLGWSGYWAWDPVENSSLVPWLFATALLHSLLVHDRLGQLKRVSLVTAFFAFFFSYFGTFITRSGIIGSVHAFAQSAVGAYYLVFLAILMLVVLGIYHLRSDSILPEEKAKEWGFTRESFLLLGQFLLLTFAVIIFIGTVYPIVSEAITGVRFNIQAPYFNSFAPYLGLGFILTITIGNMLRYRRHRLEGGKTLVLASLLLALPSAAALHYWGEIWRSSGGLWWIQTIGSYLCAWSGWSLSLGLWHKIRTYGDGPWRYILRYLSSIGAYLAHMGLVLAIFGFLGNYRGVDHTVTLKKGEHTTLLGFTLTFQGLRTTMRDNVQLYQAPFLVQRDNVTVGTVTPARSKYPTHNDLLHEVGLWGSLWQDLYVVLADFAADEQGAVTVQIHINPTVRIVWQSAFLLVVGGLLALVGSGINRPKKTRRLRRRLRHKQGEVVTAGLLLLLAAALAFLPSKTLWASADIRTFAHEFEQLPPGQQAEVREIAKELRCPTCTGLSVLESDAPFSLQMRSAVLDQVKQGREKSEILQFFVERYGLWILREPPRHGLHLFAWIVPCLFLILGPAVLMYLRYRRRGREDSSPYRSRSRREIIQEMQHELAALRRRQLGSQGESR